jgi:uncharacterized protein YndB with AHSA1/START domain
MRILLILALVVVVLVGVVAQRPSEFRIERTTIIAAPASAVFAQVNDFHKWGAWNPWGKLDPDMRQTYEGVPWGVGAAYAWTGNRHVGEGRMTITESRPNELIRVRLEFLKPFANTATAEFTFRPRGNDTAVTWSMTGTNNFMAKAFHLVMNMDRMIGGQFDKGLADMKAAVESAPRITEPRS